VLVQLVTSAALLKRPIDPELTEMALRKIVPSRDAGRRLDPREVVDAVASFFGITREVMASRTRRRQVLVPRQLAMYLCRRYTDASLPEIGCELGRDHPAVRNAIEVVERAILQRAPLRYRVEELASRLDAIAGRR
jgi:chromosomal replication initiator protein